MENEVDMLRLERQLCFPLYTASRLVTQCYHPILQELGVTYPQYLVLLVLWENEDVSIGYVSEKLRLQSNTLAPMLKRMEELGLINKYPSSKDERSTLIKLSDQGRGLKALAAEVPPALFDQLEITEKEAKQLYSLLYKLIETLENKKP